MSTGIMGIDTWSGNLRGFSRPSGDDGSVLGDDFLVWLTLALGGAMVVGNTLALLRPREQRRDESDLDRAPTVRSVAFIVVGA